VTTLRATYPILAALLLIVTVAPFHAFSADEKAPDDCGKYLKEMKENLEALEVLVPTVPPDEAAYLDKEDSAAVKAKSNERIYEVEHRPYYTAWNFHNVAEDARGEIERQSESATLDDLKFKIEMASRLPYRMTEARIAWIDFAWIDFDNADLTLKQSGEGGMRSVLISELPGQYIWCLAR
jgi:hypothetical protein